MALAPIDPNERADEVFCLAAPKRRTSMSRVPRTLPSWRRRLLQLSNRKPAHEAVLSFGATGRFLQTGHTTRAVPGAPPGRRLSPEERVEPSPRGSTKPLHAGARHARALQQERDFRERRDCLRT